MSPEVSTRAAEVLERLASHQGAARPGRVRIDLPTAAELGAPEGGRRGARDPDQHDDPEPERDRTGSEEGTGRARRVRRGAAGDAAGDPAGGAAGPGLPWAPLRRPDAVRELPIQVRAVAAALALAVVIGVVWLQRRPPPIEERMPMAQQVAEQAIEPQVSSEPDGLRAAGADAADSNAGPLLVHVAGAVASPGVVELPGDARVVDAVAAAGGLRPDADPDRVNLAAPVGDGQRVVVPVVGEPPPQEVVPSGPTGASGALDGGMAEPVVDLNTADSSQLERLPGIGPATAAAIIAHREAHGPFRSVESLIDVRGIGEAKLAALADLVTVGGAR